SGTTATPEVITPRNPVFSLDVPAPVWQGFLVQATKQWEIRDFVRPTGITEATVDAFTGMAPGAFTTSTIEELFIEGTDPRIPDDTKFALQIEEEPGLLGPKAVR